MSTSDSFVPGRGLKLDLQGHVATLEFSRPPLNFFDKDLIMDLVAALEHLDQLPECRVVILQAEGKTFCAGADFTGSEETRDPKFPRRLYKYAVRMFRTRKPLIHSLLYNDKVLDVARIQQQLQARGQTAVFERRLLNATYWLSGTFFFSAAMNYILARWLVSSPAGSEAFNAELAHMNLLSYPMIAIPSMLMMMAIFYYLWRTIHDLTGLGLDDIMAAHHRDKH
ncbi:enoyl-CoA hydratase [compost metagenome]